MSQTYQVLSIFCSSFCNCSVHGTILNAKNLQIHVNSESSVKHVRSDFVISETPPPSVCALRFQPKPPPPNTSVRTLFFKEDVVEIYFANYYQSNNHKLRYKIKKQLYKVIGKRRIKTPKRALESSLRILKAHFISIL